jgi:hypothetical protein
MSEYDLLRAMVVAAPGQHTTRALCRAAVVAHGGQPRVWMKRLTTLIDGQALVTRLNPEARRLKTRLRVYVGPASVATALAYEATAPSRTRTRVSARTGDDGHATPLTPEHVGKPPSPERLAAEMSAWIDAAWPTMSLSDRAYYDHDRLAREQRRGRYSGALLTDAGRRRSDAMPAMGQPGNDYRENW